MPSVEKPRYQAKQLIKEYRANRNIPYDNDRDYYYKYYTPQFYAPPPILLPPARKNSNYRGDFDSSYVSKYPKYDPSADNQYEYPIYFDN